MDNKNTQKAGDNSNQVQLTNCNVSFGITEEKVRELIKDENKLLIASCNEIARDVAMIRSKKIEEKFVAELVKGKLLEELKRPEVLVAVRETEEQAICTDDEKSYELLSKILSNRIKYSNDRLVVSSLKNATEVATQITDEALSGLTISFLMSKYGPATVDITQGLKFLNDMYGIVNLTELPKDKSWLEQLDILKLARINSFGGMKKMIDYYYEVLSGYVCVGIKKDSDRYKKAVEILEGVKLSKYDLVTHELNGDYVRLPISTEKDFESVRHFTSQGMVSLTAEQRKAYEKINQLYEKNDAILNSNKKAFKIMWDKFPNLVKVREWWDNIKPSFDITIVGKVLAYTNINNINKNVDLPQLELRDLIR